MKYFVLFLLICFHSKAQNLPQLGKDSMDKVIAAMTLEEKVSLVVGTGLKFGDAIDNNESLKIPNKPKKGTMAAKTKVYVSGAIGRTLEIPRLGITTIEMCDGPAGLSFGSRSTSFPIATSLASTWDEELIYQVGKAMGNETLEYGLDILLTPAINIHRNSLGGRNFEYYSEDPLLSGKIGSSLINGLQSQGVGSSLKHFAANNQETNRIEVDAIISERALREIYLKGFEIAIKESNPLTLMASYNSINGKLATQNKELLTTIARNEWGYKGIIMTDWEAGKDPIAQMKAGVNLLMPGPYQDSTLYQALKEGRLSEKTLDENIAWILKGIQNTQKFKKYSYSNKPALVQNAFLVQNAAAQGMVLLKNDTNTLPLTDKTKTISLFGNGSYETIIGGSGSGFVMTAGTTTHIFEGLTSDNFNISQNIKHLYQKYITENTPKQNRIDLTRGRKKRPSEMVLKDSLIARMAEETDYAIMTISRISGETTDRSVENDFNLSKTEKDNIENICMAFHKKGKKVIVLLNVGGVVETASWKNLPDAILITWLPGQEAGKSVTDVLSGRINPSGKLTTSFPIKYQDEPSSKNFPGTPIDKPKEVIYEEGIYVGYRYFESFGVETSYPFGYGLSYTTFSYNKLNLSSNKLKNKIELAVTIKNTGKVEGKETVQLYISAPSKEIDKPIKELKGFIKTKLLKPQESQTLTFVLDADNLASFNTNKSAWITDAGRYTVSIGASIKDIKLVKSFNVAKNIQIKTVQRALSPMIKINELTSKVKNNI